MAAIPDPVDLLQRLVRCPSVTPDEAGTLAVLTNVLQPAGFAVERVTFTEPGTPDVANLFATIGGGAPHVAFCGHVDVVPPGDAAGWTHPPFSAEIADGMLYGRGAADMKGGIAAFVAAAIQHRAAGKGRGTISLLITADEEGPSINGVAKLLPFALAKAAHPDAAIVGEPTSRAKLGDMVKVGRRGSLSATLKVFGKQGHVAYPERASNPVTAILGMLTRLKTTPLDEGNASFPASNLEVTSIDVGNPTTNVIPAEATARFNIRFNNHWTRASLRDWIAAQLAASAGGMRHELVVLPGGGESFLTPAGPLVEALVAAIKAETGLDPERSTSGGTSDARFFKDVCPVVEFGAVGETIHQVDERTSVADLYRLSSIYRRFLDRFLA
ncbi:MAG: succinyl-diaminopimelate desuccinylase [Rhizobiales bacterium]|nr:succinyl-diaminopimelate desuccinylase [Hyphomicrobiales bacterium]